MISWVCWAAATHLEPGWATRINSATSIARQRVSRSWSILRTTSDLGMSGLVNWAAKLFASRSWSLAKATRPLGELRAEFRNNPLFFSLAKLRKGSFGASGDVLHRRKYFSSSKTRVIKDVWSVDILRRVWAHNKVLWWCIRRQDWSIWVKSWWESSRKYWERICLRTREAAWEKSTVWKVQLMNNGIFWHVVEVYSSFFVWIKSGVLFSLFFCGICIIVKLARRVGPLLRWWEIEIKNM